MISNVCIFHVGVHQIVRRVLGIKIVAPESNDPHGLYSVYHKQSDVVMLGDSITHHVEWDELLNRINIANRGIGSDTTVGMFNRLEFVYKVNPRLCFILAGINDFGFGATPNEVFISYKKIITNLREHNIIPIIQSTLYANEKNYKSKSIEELNRLLKQYAENNSLDYIDLNMVLSEHKKLKKEFTYDGTHLTGKGYEVWGREVLKTLNKYGL